MSQQQSSYQQIMKATSIFGGVQIIQILVQIIRSKAIAILLGPAGMGINSLLSSTLGLMQGLTNFGLQTSAVKNVAEANSSDDARPVALIVTVLKRWVWLTGLLGTLLTLLLSPWLSKLTFGNSNYTLAFVWISISLLFRQLSVGQMTILQGLRKLNYLANANLSGAFLGLAVTVPMYYLWGVDGIVPAIIATSVINMFLSWYFSRKVKLETITVSRMETWNEGKQMLTMGFMISLSGLMTTGTAYLLRIFISNFGSLDDVGLYSAGFAIINTYVGLVFSAMGTDYYPRLSSVAECNLKAKQTINQQAEITMLILAPILVVFIVFIRWVVVVLYSNQFTAINGMIQWAAMGMYFKAISWCIAFVFLAKGASKLFFWNELLANCYILLLNVLGYHVGGLNGLGISFVITYFIYLIQVYIIAKKHYNFIFTFHFAKIFAIQIMIGTITFIVVKLTTGLIMYSTGSILLILSSLYSLRELNKRLNLKELVTQIAIRKK